MIEVKNILRNADSESPKIFLDDFDDIKKYFDETIKNWSATPQIGGIDDRHIPFSDRYPRISIDPKDMTGYFFDSGNRIREIKESIFPCVDYLLGGRADNDTFTLCPSASFAILAAFITLKKIGIDTILFETPSYFGSYEQAQSIGLETFFLPTRFDDGFLLQPDDLSNAISFISGRCALVLTQPKFGTGVHRSEEEICALIARLRDGDGVIIDEAADQIPTLNVLDELSNDRLTWFRVRGLTKGLGLNSIKLCLANHSRTTRSYFSEVAEFCGGALDAGSLTAAKNYFFDVEFARMQFESTRQYVADRFCQVSKLCSPYPIHFFPIASGYFSTAAIKTGVESGAPVAVFEKWRRKFLNICRDRNFPVILGTSMYFPYDFEYEFIRVNYFSSEENIGQAALALNDVVADVFSA